MKVSWCTPVHTALCGDVETTDSWGCGPKTGEVLGDIRGFKISLYAMQMTICKNRLNVIIPYFRPSKCRPLRIAARAGCFLRPPRPATDVATLPLSPTVQLAVFAPPVGLRLWTRRHLIFVCKLIRDSKPGQFLNPGFRFGRPQTRVSGFETV